MSVFCSCPYAAHELLLLPPFHNLRCGWGMQHAVLVVQDCVEQLLLVGLTIILWLCCCAAAFDWLSGRLIVRQGRHQGFQ